MRAIRFFLRNGGAGEVTCEGGGLWMGGKVEIEGKKGDRLPECLFVIPGKTGGRDPEFRLWTLA